MKSQVEEGGADEIVYYERTTLVNAGGLDGTCVNSCSMITHHWAPDGCAAGQADPFTRSYPWHRSLFQQSSKYTRSANTINQTHSKPRTVSFPHEGQ